MAAKQTKPQRRPRNAATSARRTPSARATLPAIVRDIFTRTRTPGFRRYLRNLVIELCRIDTTPSPDVARMRDAEDGCFRIIERELGSLGFPGARLERRSINPAIQTHQNFSLLHFTKTPQRPQGLTPEETYSNRSNLLCFLPGISGTQGQSVALNAHVDVVAPYFPPRVRGGTIYGRGACDDKGPAVSLIAALKVLSEAMPKTGLKWNRNVLAMLVVEEETGGNGSLSLAMDRELRKLYDSILVCECTDLKFYPANRGAVWYRAELNPPPGVSAFEMFAYVNEEMEKEGVAIRAESRHPLFPQRPVQTCHGIIGPFGEHPSRICGAVSFAVRFDRPPDGQTEALVSDCLAAGLAGYVGLYGDKTKVTDPATGKPVVARHYDLRREGNGFVVDVYGATGHMGAIRERDGAITKMAHLVRSLVASRAKLEASAGGPVRVELAPRPGREGSASGHNRQSSFPPFSPSPQPSPPRRGRGRTIASVSPRLAHQPCLTDGVPGSLSPAEGERAGVRGKIGGGVEMRPREGQSQSTGLKSQGAPATLVLEGGQGFIPTHGIIEVMDRLRHAAQRGAEHYLHLIGRSERGADVVTVAYEKLHNVAFDGDPDSPTVRNAIAAAKACGLWKDEPILGWTVSCDARLFATEYPEMQVLTFGPGQLAFAHSDQEQIALDDIRAAAEFLAVFLLKQTGTLE